jgi:GT2 family glycosyltransferase
MDVSIVIINYNTYALICDCVRSVIEFTKELTYEIIVVDNASKEFDSQSFKTKFPSVKLILSEENLGFAGGNNLGNQYATGKYILLLNSDTYLKENSILTTFKYLETRPKVGVVSARLIFPDGRYQSVAQRFPSPKYLLMELLRLQKFLPKKQAGKLLLGAFFNHDENTEVDWVWGAYFMFRKEILDRLPEKKLDDSYFMYFEDMQWCMDIKKLGYQIHYYADAEVVHIMGGSSGSKTKLMEQYEPVFLKRNYSKVEVWLIQKLKKMLTP